MNKKMAYSDAGACLATAVALDQVAPEQFDAVRGQVVLMCADVSKFITDGKLSDLPLDVARQAIVDYMVKKGWTAYVSLVDVIFGWVSVQQVDVQKLGENNVIIIKQGLDAISRQAARAQPEWARPIGTAKAPVVPK
jgi:hypothetical protein